ncbi:Fe2+-dependent dioxygenase [Schlegelella sp. S2-27]|uniref:Fe2+-dependent dioxygenase n=1 Tax=Caldimonas mangrovi TaxID=2944811 RepID=A0ABT0YK37_9BURK|nr:Fe2+-dependent dioxygenase [Caldimonas mangrovi]MCM5679092.1 Fe2+-dependent dioxygenase [Caldimonas mangrovi]
MLLHLQNILTAEELRAARTTLQAASWIDGSSTAGQQALNVKNNQQLPQDGEASRSLRALVLGALNRHALFFSAALPKKIFNPLFNRYGGSTNHYGKHVDGAVLHSRASGERVRSDVSCTLFLSEPGEYDGGELVIDDTYGSQRIKLPAGDMVIYPGTSVHGVAPVTRGERLASFFWVESMVRSDEQRRLLFDLDMNLLKLRQRDGESELAVALSGTYHNLLRMWATT